MKFDKPNVAIIGFGTMGRYTAEALSPKVKSFFINDSKYVRDKDITLRNPTTFKLLDWEFKGYLKHADIAIFCTPTDQVEQSMQTYLPFLKNGTFVTGQTSRKTPESKTFDLFRCRRPDLEMVSLHTMCNPAKSDPTKEILGLIRHHASDETYAWARGFFGDMSEHIEEFASVEEHDTMTANTQINTSRTNLSIASSFAEAGCFPWVEGAYGSGLDVMKFSLAMRTASLKDHVYRGIQFGSEYGKELVSKAVEVENDLYGMILANQRDEYAARVIEIKNALFGEKEREPILRDEEVAQFSIGEESKPNSHSSLIQWAGGLVANGINPFEHLKATTPNYTALLLLTDYVFNRKELLRESVHAPFDHPQLRQEDLVFHSQSRGWSDALLFDNVQGYNSRHKQMTDKLEQLDVSDYVEKSKDVTRVCREALARERDRVMIH
tara:strand:+ start:2852 stop:4165 length:1314 start_codon:yes stop_codon:yes gene_type:complete